MIFPQTYNRIALHAFLTGLSSWLVLGPTTKDVAGYRRFINHRMSIRNWIRGLNYAGQERQRPIAHPTGLTISRTHNNIEYQRAYRALRRKPWVPNYQI